MGGSINGESTSLANIPYAYTPEKSANSKKVVCNTQSSFPKGEMSDTQKQNERLATLIGATIRGILIKHRGGYFIKWNNERYDSVYVSATCVERDLGWQRLSKSYVCIVRCTIERLVPATQSGPISPRLAQRSSWCIATKFVRS